MDSSLQRHSMPSAERPSQRDSQGSNDTNSRKTNVTWGNGSTSTIAVEPANSKRAGTGGVIINPSSSFDHSHTARREGGGIDDDVFLPAPSPPCNAGHGFFSTTNSFFKHGGNNNDTSSSTPTSPKTKGRPPYYPTNQYHDAPAAPSPSISPHPPPMSWPKRKKLTGCFGTTITSDTVCEDDGIASANNKKDYNEDNNQQQNPDHINNIWWCSWARADLDRGMRIDFYNVQDSKLLASWASFFRDQYILASTAAHNNASRRSTSASPPQHYQSPYMYGRPPNYYHHHHHSGYHYYYYDHHNQHRHRPLPSPPQYHQLQPQKTSSAPNIVSEERAMNGQIASPHSSKN